MRRWSWVSKETKVARVTGQSIREETDIQSINIGDVQKAPFQFPVKS